MVNFNGPEMKKKYAIYRNKSFAGCLADCRKVSGLGGKIAILRKERTRKGSRIHAQSSEWAKSIFEGWTN